MSLIVVVSHRRNLSSSPMERETPAVAGETQNSAKGIRLQSSSPTHEEAAEHKDPSRRTTGRANANQGGFRPQFCSKSHSMLMHRHSHPEGWRALTNPCAPCIQAPQGQARGSRPRMKSKGIPLPSICPVGAEALPGHRGRMGALQTPLIATSRAGFLVQVH